MSDVVFTDATSQPTNTLAEWAATDAEAARDGQFHASLS